MDDSLLHLPLGKPPRKDGSAHYIMLTKDQKPICRTQCLNPPFQMPPFWNISTIVREKTIHFLNELPHCFLHPAPQNSRDQREWRIFLGFLQKNMMVAVAKFQLYELYILPPSEGSNFSHAVVAYRLEKAHKVDDDKTNGISVAEETMIQPAQLLSPEASSHTNQTCRYMQPSTASRNACVNSRPVSPLGETVVPSCFTAKEFADRSDAYKTGRCSANSVDRCPHNKFTQDTGDHNASDFETQTYIRSQLNAVKQDGHLEKNYVRADPSYLKTLGQAHSGWIFGAIAELVDNSRDAKATKLDISIEMIYSKKAGEDIPMLSVKDDGQGMSHQEIVRMVSFGHKQPDTDDPDHIGRFGIGFKTGAMRLGRDAFVLTQTSCSRSIAFLSQSLNEGKDNLEIPIVSYYRHGQVMELDESVHSEAFAKYNLKAIKEFSPFNKYSIGMKAGLFCEKGTGTQVYIWNLDKWGSDYCLEWHNGMSSGSSFYQGDILIRSRRVRSRPGQISQKVPLDYSLRSYLEVIFLNPRMKIFIQGSLVKSRPLAKSLNNTVIENGIIMGKPVQLTLGRCQLEWEQANCGIFLYWHGRLIEGYKRVGGMIHNADMGRGVIGVIDVTDIMNDGNGHVWVHSNKQGFQDCEPYAWLEEWLGSKADEFWDTNFDALQLKKGNNLYKPDHEWVQCDKCRKWRVLSSGFRANDLPQEWFCYMEPFNGLCETPEQKVARGVITVSAKRSGCDPSQKPVQCDNVQILCSTNSLESISGDDSSQTPEDVTPVLKRLRRGPSRSCKKAKR